MFHWGIIVTKNNKKQASDFLAAVKQVSRKIGMQIGELLKVVISRNTVQNYRAELEKLIKPPLNMVVIIFLNLRQDKYSMVKE